MPFWSNFSKKRTLRALLNTGNPGQQVKAASDLAELGDFSGLPVLGKYLESSKDSDGIPYTMYCVSGLVHLARTGSQEALTLLIQAAHSTHRDTAYGAIVSLSWDENGLHLPPGTLLELCPEPYVRHLIRRCDPGTMIENENVMRQMPKEFLPVLKRVYAQDPFLYDGGKRVYEGKVSWTEGRQELWSERATREFIHELEGMVKKTK